MTCLLCGRNIQSASNRFAAYSLLCIPCSVCGEYVTDQFAASEIADLLETQKFGLVSLLHEYRLKSGNVGSPVGLFSESCCEPAENTVHRDLAHWWYLDAALKCIPQPHELVDRALLNLSRLVQHPMDSVTLPKMKLQYFVFCPEKNLANWVYHMRDMRFVMPGSEDNSNLSVSISPEGWERISQLKEVRSESKQCFVAMWFNEETDLFFKEGIVPALEATGLKACRIDNKEHVNKICDEIVAEIRRSRFLVADFTCGQCKHCNECHRSKECPDRYRARGGVYFEAGFALGLKLPVIWTVHRDQMHHVHFDTRQYNHICYDSPQNLSVALERRIRALGLS